MTTSKSESGPQKKVAVIYYLSRNGKFEHPHFVEVPLSSAHGLHLTDVMKTLNLLRGQGMATMFSWASKRNYKNGYIWQDLSEDDFIHPCNGHDYILKGSLLEDNSFSFRSNDSISSSISRRSSSDKMSSEDSNSPVRKNNESEYKIYKAKTAGQLSTQGSDVSTQTDENPRRRKHENEKAQPSRSLAGNNVKYDDDSIYNRRRRTNDSKVGMKLIKCGCGPKKL